MSRMSSSRAFLPWRRANRGRPTDLERTNIKSDRGFRRLLDPGDRRPGACEGRDRFRPDRKSTRLNSSHLGNSYAVFSLKKKFSEAVVACTRSRLPTLILIFWPALPTRTKASLFFFKLNGARGLFFISPPGAPPV